MFICISYVMIVNKKSFKKLKYPALIFTHSVIALPQKPVSISSSARNSTHFRLLKLIQKVLLLVLFFNLCLCD